MRETRRTRTSPTNEWFTKVQRDDTAFTKVRATDLLFTIDPREYVAARKAAEATLAEAEAGVGLAKIEAKRQKDLLARRATSEIEKERADAQLKASDAKVLQAKSCSRIRHTG